MKTYYYRVWNIKINKFVIKKSTLKSILRKNYRYWPILSQFTGFRDKYKNDIFVEDYVIDKNGIFYKVGMHEDSVCLYTKDGKMVHLWNKNRKEFISHDASINKPNQFIIIGNIYENYNISLL